MQDKMSGIRGVILKCRGCGKPLLERLPNGLFRFKYGRQQRKLDKDRPPVTWNPVLVYIHGSVRIRCFRQKCRVWNTYQWLPSGEFPENRENETSGELK